MATPLSPKQLITIDKLASGQSITAIASELDISREQIYTWKRDPHFQAALNKLLEDLREARRSKLIHLQTQAISTLEALMVGGEVPHSIRLQSAIAILKLAEDRKPLPTDPKAIASKQAWDDLFELRLQELKSGLL